MVVSFGGWSQHVRELFMGKISFEFTINVFKRNIGDKLRNSNVWWESHCRYSLYEFFLVMMVWTNKALDFVFFFSINLYCEIIMFVSQRIWTFEAISSLEIKFAKKYTNANPKMLAWKMSKRLTSVAIEKVLK